MHSYCMSWSFLFANWHEHLPFFKLCWIQHGQIFMTDKFSCNLLLMLVKLMPKNVSISWYITCPSCFICLHTGTFVPPRTVASSLFAIATQWWRRYFPPHFLHRICGSNHSARLPNAVHTYLKDSVPWQLIPKGIRIFWSSIVETLFSRQPCGGTICLAILHPVLAPHLALEISIAERRS